MTENIAFNDIVKNNASIVDPNGFVFHKGGNIYRAVYDKVADFYNDIYDNGVIADLVNKMGFIPTEKTNFTINELHCNLVFKHHRVTRVSYCTEWCASMLKDAAELTLNLNIELLKKNMVLQDAYPWNVLFDGTKPYFVDMTSVIPNEGPLLWKAHQQFMNFFYYPLLLNANNKGKWVRYSLQDPIAGINVVDAFNLADVKLLFTHPGDYLKMALESRLYHYFETKQEMKLKLRSEFHKRANKKPPTELQIRFNESLLKKVSKFKFLNENDAWASYYNYQDNDCEPEKKTQFIDQILKQLGHKTLLDLGCNTGRFSIVAAKNNYKVTAVDGSEKCIESLYAYAKKNHLDILPLVSDLSNPVPAYGFQSNQFAGLTQRAHSDVVMCLGLMHHLHINCRQPFDKISEMLNSLTKKVLIFEYVDFADANNQLLDQGREINYSLESVKATLTKYFNIREFDSDRPTRKMLVCEKR